MPRRAITTRFSASAPLPVFHQFATALNARRSRFHGVYPGVVESRLANERSPEEFIELVLDDTSDPPGRRRPDQPRPWPAHDHSERRDRRRRADCGPHRRRRPHVPARGDRCSDRTLRPFGSRRPLVDHVRRPQRLDLIAGQSDVVLQNLIGVLSKPGRRQFALRPACPTA